MLRTIKDEERKEWRAYELRAMKEQGAKLGVLTLSYMSGMKEPD